MASKFIIVVVNPVDQQYIFPLLKITQSSTYVIKWFYLHYFSLRINRFSAYMVFSQDLNIKFYEQLQNIATIK
jgi:hypothetical protein